MQKAIYPGTFDPFTEGHLDILTRASKLFDEITILIAVSPNKKPILTLEERLEIFHKIFKPSSLKKHKIKVEHWDGLVVDYAKENNISHIVRGLRPTGDFELEFQMGSMNKKLYPKVETIFFMTDSHHYYVSSSLVKEIFNHGGDISPFVPKEVLKYLNKKFRK